MALEKILRNEGLQFDKKLENIDSTQTSINTIRKNVKSGTEEAKENNLKLKKSEEEQIKAHKLALKRAKSFENLTKKVYE